MPIKFCYKSEIHRVQKTPKDFAALLQALKEIFHNEVPAKFSLQYEDSEGDKIVLSNDEDYKLALESDSSKTVKIYLSEVEDSSNTTFISKSMLDDLNTSSTKVSKAEIKIEEPVKVAVEKKVQSNYIQATIDDIRICENVGQAFNRGFQRRHVRPVQYSNMPCYCDGKRECADCLGTGLLRRSVARKKEMLQKLVRDTLFQELPMIVSEVKRSLGQPEEAPMKMIKPAQRENKAVHRRITCDVCGTKPIVGFRYKCSVTDDYDMCENCEAIVDHPYPLIKIKDESQHPIQVITILNEDAYPEQPMHFQQQNQDLISNLLSAVQNTMATQEQNTQTAPAKVNKQEDETPMDSKDETPQGNMFDATFVKEINTIPETIQVNDLTVYKTVSLKNNGMSAWPKNAYIESEGEIMGESCKLPSVDSGKDFSTVLIIQSPKKAGTFQSNWRFGYIDENGNKKAFGDVFTVEFSIAGEKSEEVVAEPKQCEKKKYDSETTQKAEMLMEIFPEAKFDDVCEYIEQDNTKSIEDLIFEYMSLLA